ncbi:MAG: NADH-quinone oxidoreductase subunit J, partial [Nitrospinaceae bacterium]|nr:NADH-quinone oxidoreductase subunit J [Nitrospinaceae bacterium]NIR56004.1 NADH-quinone oxidoreductase subunit J [Nitrospinaceae bacterium]NIS86447.1 NADH-quinone oxidoreductase subunit J [Nitrospinaceae bacterium]NIT83284.1 NADH-quinone oxidoreductase subunit J [Nitrospinaceae bacterium]NIU45492.1 NADH-quinone oxidoreductase subunit J [Nitrospinaceae bacterium]
MELLIFYPIALLCVILALGVIFNKSPIGSAICLIGMMLGLAGVFALQHAHFLAILQVIIYAGAIMVLFLFVIMLLNLKGDDTIWKARPRNKFLSILTGLL